MHRRWIAETVGIPEHLLRVVAPDIGGGFGAKMHLYPEELICAHLARELQSPVKWWESRSESHQATTHGRAHTEMIEVAFRNDGRILGMKVETLGNVGGYLSNMASGGPTMAGSYGTGTYKIENFEAVAKVILTNTVPVDAYRGYGRPEAAYIAERTIEAVARHLGLDPVAVRRIKSPRWNEPCPVEMATAARPPAAVSLEVREVSPPGTAKLWCGQSGMGAESFGFVGRVAHGNSTAHHLENTYLFSKT
jgi:CO/xanthine dehydrogenase Mo-binding subunit